MKSHKAWIEHPTSGFAVTPQLAEVHPLDGGVRTVTTIQVNHPEPSALAIANFGFALRTPCIAQARGEAFPVDDCVSWLFDASGGRGVPAWTRVSHARWPGLSHARLPRASHQHRERLTTHGGTPDRGPRGPLMADG